jgi:hypothetical protein
MSNRMFHASRNECVVGGRGGGDDLDLSLETGLYHGRSQRDVLVDASGIIVNLCDYERHFMSPYNYQRRFVSLYDYQRHFCEPVRL